MKVFPREAEARRFKRLRSTAFRDFVAFAISVTAAVAITVATAVTVAAAVAAAVAVSGAIAAADTTTVVSTAKVASVVVADDLASTQGRPVASPLEPRRAFADQAEVLPPIDGYRFSRPIRDVERGWVRVPLGQEFVGKIMPDGRDVRVLDERGRIVQHAILDRDDDLTPIRAQVISVDEHDAGWLVTIDTKLDPSRHVLYDGLRFDFEGSVNVPGIRLETSNDGVTWSDLAIFDLFRLGDSPTMARTGLNYPPTDERFLRFDWPESAGFPELDDVSVLPSAMDKAVFEVEFVAMPRPEAPGLAEYRLVRPWLELATDMNVHWEGAGSAAYRLTSPSEGRWIERSAGMLNADSSGWIPLRTAGSTPWSDPSAAWRLELFASGEAEPTVRRIETQILQQWLYFVANDASPYTLAYGAVDLALPDESTIRPDQSLGTMPIAELGAEVEHDLPPVDPELAANGGPMPRTRFAAAWPIITDAVSPGDVVQLELPDAVFVQSTAGLSDMRVDANGRQVPFLRRSPPDPALVFESGDLIPEPVSERRRNPQSAVWVDLPLAPLPLSELEITAGEEAFERRMTVEWVDGDEDIQGLADPERSHRLIETTTWRCEGRSPAPCRIAIGLAVDRARRLQIRFDDGDNVPLDSVSVRVWRRRESVRFVWPEGEAPVLRVGAIDVGLPDYDLTALEGALIALPAGEVTLGEREPLTGLAGASAAAEDSGWLPTAALGLAALAMLAVLWRVLRASSQADI